MYDDFSVEWTPRAMNDLRNIVRYIAEHEFTPDAAARLERDVLDAAGKLSNSPYRPVVDRERMIRKCVVRNIYVILFKIHEDNNTIKIRRIFDGRRNWLTMAW